MPIAPPPRRRHNVLTAILGLLLLLTGTVAWADDRNPLTLDDDTRQRLIGQHLEFLEDPRGTLTFKEASALDNAQRYRDNKATVPNLGFTRSAYWARFSLHNTAGNNTLWYLDYGDAMFQYIDVFIRHQNGQVTRFVGGSMQTPSTNTLKAYTHVFPIRLGWDERVDIYLRLKTDYAFVAPLSVWHPDEYARSKTGISTLHGLYMGIALAMLVYNLALLIAFREWVYLWYVLFVAIVLVNNTCLNGLMRFHTEISSGWLNTYFSLSYNIGVIACWLFCGAFLKAGPVFDRITWIGMLVNVLIILMYSAGLTIEWTILTGMTVQLSSVIVLSFGIRQALRGSRAALFFCLGFGSFLGGVILFTSALFDVIPVNPLTYYATEIGSALEALLLSLALSDKMRQMRAEKDRSQQALYDSQQQQLLMIENYSRTLEADVAARTRELSARTDELSARTDELSTKNVELTAQRQALQAKTDELVAAQQKLVASEKMAALGVFTAGMAHEINNPANFVSVGAQNTAAQLAEFRGFVSDLLSDDPDPEITDAFDTRFRKLEKSNATIKEGISRIENVVKQLRADHPEGDTGMQPADAVAALESASRTFMLSQAGEITLTADYAARPVVPCLIAEIQQVFLALLSNAAHAIEDAVAVNGTDYKGEITLASNQADGKLVIMVSDNGIGIPADMINKVFDPFFTTKTVGRGAGLGLSMARDVVNKHHGMLEVMSATGEGTTFTLRLPLTRPD